MTKNPNIFQTCRGILAFTLSAAYVNQSLKNWTRCTSYMPEVAGVTFSDSDSVPVTKLLNPEIFQIWKFDSCSVSGYHRYNRNLPIFLLKKWPRRLCYCRNWKLTPDSCPFFHKFFTPDPGPEEKRSPDGVDCESNGHLCYVKLNLMPCVLSKI